MTIDRRRFLGALALAPAAVAGCAGARGERHAAVASEGGHAGSRSGSGSGSAVAAVRASRLPADAEPAFVFRATAARPGDVR